MIAEVIEDIGGESRRFLLTIGAMEKIAKVQPMPAVLLGALQTEHYTLAELRAVLDATGEAGGGAIRSAQAIEALGLKAAAALALRILVAGFRDDSGN